MKDYTIISEMALMIPNVAYRWKGMHGNRRPDEVFLDDFVGFGDEEYIIPADVAKKALESFYETRQHLQDAIDYLEKLGAKETAA